MNSKCNERVKGLISPRKQQIGKIPKHVLCDQYGTRGLNVTAIVEHAHSRIYQITNILFNGTSLLTQIKEVLVYELNYTLMFRLIRTLANEAVVCFPGESRRRLES